MITKKWLTVKEAVDLTGACDQNVRRRAWKKQYRSRYVKGDHGDELRFRTADVLKDVEGSRSNLIQEISIINTVGKDRDPRQVPTGDSCPEGEQVHVTERLQDSWLKVLIVDDSPIAVRQITTILQELGAEVLTVEDGEKALDVMEREDPDLGHL